jgi:RNA polymerase sigma factor (sigma-70 family)
VSGDTGGQAVARGSRHDVSRIRTDPDAFESFYRRHFDGVARYVARRVDDPHLAADLIADVFVAAIDSAETYRPTRGNPTQWLYGVARNVVAAERRREARDLRAVGRVSGRSLLGDDDLADLIDRIEAESHRRRLADAVDRLSNRDRALVELVWLDGVPIKDAANVLGIAPVTARVRLHRARKAMKAMLAGSSDRSTTPYVIAREGSS